MFGIGNTVVHSKTKHCGKVIGYGHEIVDGVYTSTLKVLIAHAADDPHKKCFIEEDVQSAWAATSEIEQFNCL